jgi:hypothetical protein
LTLSDGTEIEVDTSELPEFDNVAAAKAALADESFWAASVNNDMGYIPGTLILNRES